MQKKCKKKQVSYSNVKNSNLRNSTNTTRLLNAIQAILYTSLVPSPGRWGLGTRLTAHSALALEVAIVVTKNSFEREMYVKYCPATTLFM